MTRDSTLKAIVKITSHKGINIPNIATLTPRMFDLLHKAQRTIHLNTLEALWSIITNYSQQFQASSAAILKELIPFINDNDMQVSAWALKVSIPVFSISGPGTPEVQTFISKASELSKSHLIQGQSLLVNELLGFFQTAAQCGAIQDKTLGDLYSNVSLKSQAAAMCLARAVVFNKDQGKKVNVINDMKNKLNAIGNEVQGCLCLGELGKLQDLSSSTDVIDKLKDKFKVQDEAIRTAASICLGNISVGNPDFFLEKVFKLVDAAEHHEKYLFLNTLREIIQNNAKCLKPFINKLLPLLIEQSKNQDE